MKLTINEIPRDLKDQITKDYKEGLSIVKLAKKYTFGWYTIKRIVDPSYEKQFKKVQNTYRLKPESKAHSLEYNLAYQKEPEVKERRAQIFKDKYHNDPEFKARKKRIYKKWYKKSGREYFKEYNKLPNSLANARKWTRIRNARKVEVIENYTELDEQYTKKLFSNQCAICGSAERLEIDHWKPLSKGHALTRDNAVLLCKHCNCKKWVKKPEQVFTKEQIKLAEQKLKG